MIAPVSLYGSEVLPLGPNREATIHRTQLETVLPSDSAADCHSHASSAVRRIAICCSLARPLAGGRPRLLLTRIPHCCSILFSPRSCKPNTQRQARLRVARA